ncbi:MAG: DUF5719 family protein [Acidimicrobiaceae bacterium]|nr:DUF5719 family protein [Acidimicrobiaceae bacterium]
MIPRPANYDSFTGRLRSARVLSLIMIVGMLAGAAVIDLRDRPFFDHLEISSNSLTNMSGPMVAWFCPGGSNQDGMAELTIELFNAARVTRDATITVIPDSLPAAQLTTKEADFDHSFSISIPSQKRVLLPLGVELPEAQWVGAVVEVASPDVIVEQIISDKHGGAGRSSCLTRTSTQWILPHGATRLEAEGEQLFLMLLNPYLDFAVVNIEMLSDYGHDSIESLVVPAGEVVKVDVTDELPVADTVTLYVEAISGRVAASWIQLVDGPKSGKGTQVATAIPHVAPLWYIPSAGVDTQRRDVVAVTNPSTDRTAAVDIEVITDQPDVTIDPIELTIAPRQTELVNLQTQNRLKGFNDFTVVVRSLEGLPVAASITSIVGDAAVLPEFTSSSIDVTDALDSDSPIDSFEDDQTTYSLQDRITPGATATIAADAAAKEWLLPVEVSAVGNMDKSDNGTVDLDADVSSVAIVNPSSSIIALVDLIVNDVTIRSLELGPQQRARFPLAWFASGYFILEIEASSPVIAGSELIGLTSRVASLGVATSEPVPLSILR